MLVVLQTARLAPIGAMLVVVAPIGYVAAAETYCPVLTQVAALVDTKERFASIIGEPREGNYLETKLPLPGWADCAFYGRRTYTCDSQSLQTAGDAERAFARTLDEVKNCLRDSWSEEPSRASPGYAVLHHARPAASITINTDRTEKNEHVVRLILFLRGQ
jgi:hypothetical protein